MKVIQVSSNHQTLEATVRRWSTKQMFLKMLQNSQENTCVGVWFLIKIQAGGTT